MITNKTAEILSDDLVMPVMGSQRDEYMQCLCYTCAMGIVNNEAEIFDVNDSSTLNVLLHSSFYMLSHALKKGFYFS